MIKLSSGHPLPDAESADPEVLRRVHRGLQTVRYPNELAVRNSSIIA